MQRLSDIFQQKNGAKTAAKSAALIPFITAGFPRLDSAPGLMRVLSAAGADIIEVGVPFSDPMADGAAIARAGEQALQNGITLAQILAQIAAFRADDSATPVVLMGYANSFINFGREKFAAAAADAGADGVIVVDLADSDRATWRKTLAAKGLALIPLLAPTTAAARRKSLVADADGFVYFISLRGVTGAAHLDTESLDEHVAAIREHTALPVAVGFGVRTAEQAAAVAQVADGVVIGSRLTEIIGAAGADAGAAENAAENFLREVSTALGA